MGSASDHIDLVLKNPQAADELLDEAEWKINTLSLFPEKHPLVEEPLLASWGICFEVRFFSHIVCVYRKKDNLRRNILSFLAYLFVTKRTFAALMNEGGKEAVRFCHGCHEKKIVIRKER